MVLLMGGSISQDDDRNSSREDFETGAKRLGTWTERLRRAGLREGAGRVLVRSKMWTRREMLDLLSQDQEPEPQEKPPFVTVGLCGPKLAEGMLQERRRNALQTFLSKGTRSWGTGKWVKI